jgi:small-conductance mechanosensitive channel
MQRVFRLVTFLLAGAVGALGAQEPPSGPQEADTVVAPAPARISPTEIPERAVATSIALTRLQARITADTATTRIGTALTALVDTIATADDAVTTARLERMSLDGLLEVEREWRNLERRLVDWQSRLGDRTRNLDAVRDSLRNLRTRWELTRDSTPRADFPTELRQRVQQTLRAIDSVQTALRPVRERILSLQSEAAQALVAVNEALVTIRQAQDVVRRQLFEQDAAPLWQLFSAPAAEAQPTSMRSESEGARLRAVAEYVTKNPVRVWVHTGLLVIMLLAVYAVRQRAATWRTSEYQIYSPADLFARPIAATVLITLALSRPIHATAPQAFFGLTWILAIPLLAVFLPSIFHRRTLRAAWAVLAIFVIEMLLDVLPVGPRVYRVGLLALQATTLVGLATFVGSTEAAQWAERSRWWRIARAAALVAVGVTGGAVIANGVGFVGLSRVLSGTVINGAAAAIALVAVVAVADGLIVVFTETTLRRMLRVVDQNRLVVVRRSTGIVHLGAVVLWLFAVGREARILQPVLDGVRAGLTTPLAIGSWSLSLGDVLVFGFAVWLTLAAAGAVRALLRDDVLRRVTLPRGMGDAVSSLAYYVLIALGFLFAIGAAGLDLSQLALVLGALSVGIGFGLQNVVNNFISGLILLFERPIQIGDTIELEGLFGKVMSIGIRSSNVRMFNGAEVIVPNGDLIAGRVVNWTLSDRRRRVDIPIGVAYGSNPRQVIELLTAVASKHPDALHDPPPVTHFVGFGDSSLDFAIWIWTANFDGWWQLRTDVFTAAFEALAEAGIEIPFPQRDLHLRSVDPKVGTVFGNPPAEGEPTA